MPSMENVLWEKYVCNALYGEYSILNMAVL